MKKTIRVSTLLRTWAVLMVMLLTACGSDVSRDTELQPEATAAVAASPAPAKVYDENQARLDAVRAALDSGLDVNAHDEAGRTALMMAAFEGHTEVVRLLLDREAEINLRDENGRSALMFAGGEGHREVAELLLAHGADPTIVDVDGESAADFAEQRGHNELAELLRED